MIPMMFLASPHPLSTGGGWQLSHCHQLLLVAVHIIFFSAFFLLGSLDKSLFCFFQMSKIFLTCFSICSFLPSWCSLSSSLLNTWGLSFSFSTSWRTLSWSAIKFIVTGWQADDNSSLSSMLVAEWSRTHSGLPWANSRGLSIWDSVKSVSSWMWCGDNWNSLLQQQFLRHYFQDSCLQDHWEKWHVAASWSGSASLCSAPVSSGWQVRRRSSSVSIMSITSFGGCWISGLL